MRFFFSFIIFLAALFISDRVLYRYRTFFRSHDIQASKSGAVLTDFDRSAYARLSALNARYGNVGSRSARVEAPQISEQNGIRTQLVSQFSDTGDLIYKVKTSFDRFGRRTNPDKMLPAHSDTAIVLIGCSFFFGSGVNDDETVSAYLQELFPDYPVINFAYGGAGPNDQLLDIRSPQINRYLTPYKNIIAVYGFISPHIQRATCNTSCYGDINYLLEKPHYSLNEKDELVLEGPHRDHYTNPILKMSLSHLQNFSLPGGLFVFPSESSDYSLNLYLRLLKEFKAELESKYHVIDFYHAFLPYSDKANMENKLSDRLIALNIKPLSIPYTELAEKPTDLFIPIDRHPSPLAHFITAQGIRLAIKKDHPELLNSAK